MSVRVYITTLENISIRPEDLILWYYPQAPRDYQNYYIGQIVLGETFSESIKISSEIENNKHLKIFQNILYGGPDANTFDEKLDDLSLEIAIVETLNLLSNEDLEIINKGVKIAKEENLCLRFQHN